MRFKKIGTTTTWLKFDVFLLPCKWKDFFNLMLKLNYKYHYCNSKPLLSIFINLTWAQNNSQNNSNAFQNTDLLFHSHFLFRKLIKRWNYNIRWSIWCHDVLLCKVSANKSYLNEHISITERDERNTLVFLFYASHS